MNSIALAKKYVALLDEVYKEASLTADLESDPTLAQAGANTNEIVIPKLSMDGLGNYDRNSGYTKGDVSLTWETVKFNYERGRMFTVDVMDNEETQNVAFGRLAGEFIRTKVAPEGDAFRFATFAGTEGSPLFEAPYSYEVYAGLGADIFSINNLSIFIEAGGGFESLTSAFPNSNSVGNGFARINVGFRGFLNK